MAIIFKFDDYEDGSVVVNSVTIDGQHFDGMGEDVVAVPKAALAKVLLKEVDKRIWLEPADHVTDYLVTLSTVPYRLRALEDERAEIVFDELLRRKFWDGPVGLRQYMETKKSVVTDRQTETGDVQVEQYEDDGDYIRLEYSAKIDGTMVGEIIEQAEQLATEIEGATDIALGSPFKSIASCNSEKEFTLSVVIPLLRRLGFTNVKYNHGKREFGKDITFARLTEFDEYERWGAQVKQGNVGGGARSQVDELIAQAEDAFKVPYYDVYTRERTRISKLLIVISGRFTENAVEKICEKIETHSLRNNIVFIDGEKIDVLAERFRISVK